MRFPSSRNSFLSAFGGSKEAEIWFLKAFGGSQDAKIDRKLSSEHVKNEKCENVYFLYPSHQKSMFLGPNGGQDGAQMKSKIDFYSLEIILGLKIDLRCEF